MEQPAVRIIADEENNALIILATPEDYARIEGAIRRLDTMPLQVLIEASIVEVILADELRYGIEWYFENNDIFGDKTGIGQLDLGDGGIGAIAPGFSYQIVDAVGQVRFVLNALAEESLLNVLSSPSLMVLDNREAEIRVGDQVPVRTEAATTEGGVIIESVQFKDTGVLLTVKPRVNVGGLVTMEISQEVTNVGDVDPATGQRTFLQRKINSAVAVGSGETVVLGGLITENKVVAESGIPVLYKIPVIGKLFGTTQDNTRRTELLVLITPRVLDDDRDAMRILDEFKLKMRSLDLEGSGVVSKQVF